MKREILLKISDRLGLVQQGKPMLVVRIVQLQFLFLCIFVVCESIAGPKNVPFWFALVAVTLFAVTVAGAIARSAR